MSSTDQSILNRIRAVMPSASFDPPATRDMLDGAERSLRVQFPDWLREIYLACNGFRGPTEVRYLYSLDGRDGVVEFTLFLRTQDWSPPWVSRAIVFSDNGIGGTLTNHWAILNGQLIEWCYGDGGQYTVAEGEIFALLSREQALWNETEANTE